MDSERLRKNSTCRGSSKIHRIVDGQSILATHGSRDVPVWGWQSMGGIKKIRLDDNTRLS